MAGLSVLLEEQGSSAAGTGRGVITDAGAGESVGRETPHVEQALESPGATRQTAPALSVPWYRASGVRLTESCRVG